MVPYTLPACDGADNYGHPCGGLYNDQGTSWECCFCHRTYPSAIPGGEWEEYISEIEDVVDGDAAQSDEEQEETRQVDAATQTEPNGQPQAAITDTSKLPNGKLEEKDESDSDTDSDNETNDAREDAEKTRDREQQQLTSSSVASPRDE